MPTDRIVTINIQGGGTYDDAGVYQRGVDRLLRRWATLIDTSLERRFAIGGTIEYKNVLYRVRYFQDLADADIRITFLYDDAGIIYTLNTITEVTGRDGNIRRRWLELDCVRREPQL